MSKMNRLRFRCLLTYIISAMLGYGSSAIAAAPSGEPDQVIDLEAGIACSFPLKVEVWSGNQITKEFKDKNDNLVRQLTAGKGSELRFTNEDTQQTFSLKSKGSVSHTTYNIDGSRTETATGHNVIILFPTDTPAGPSTTLYVGEVVYKVEPGEIFTILKESQNQTDICAAVS